MTDLRIYVASLSDYNAGRLHGVHIPIEGQDVEEIWEKVREMLAKSKEHNAEEWAIHDHEGFGKWQLSEWESFDTIALVGKVVAELDEDQVEPFLYWFYRAKTEQRIDVTDYYDDPDGLESVFTDEYRGHHDSWKDYIVDTEEGEMYLGLHHLRHAAEEMDKANSWAPGPKNATKELLEKLEQFIDWDRVASDMEHESRYDVERAEPYGVWIFEDQD
jgi:antirestriction protein